MRGLNNIKRYSIWICDRDTMYLNMLHGYLQERIGLPIGISDFTDARYLKDSETVEEVLLLIIAEEFLSEIDTSVYGAVLVLEEDEGIHPACGQGGDFRRQTEGESVYTISRYSKAAEILDAVLSVMSENKQMKDLCLTRDLPVHVIGFYSPLGRCLQTTTALAMGQLLAEKEQTLYMNFAPFPEERLVCAGRGETLADLLYYYGCDTSELKVKLYQVLADVGGLKVVPPAPSYLEIADVGASEWMSFIREICQVSGCKYLILDLSEALPCLFELMSLCEHIYTIGGRDRSDAAKMESYRRYLSLCNQSNILKKTVFMQIPQGIGTAEGLSRLSESELGAFLMQSGLLPKSIDEGGDHINEPYSSEQEIHRVREKNSYGKNLLKGKMRKDRETSWIRR